MGRRILAPSIGGVALRAGGAGLRGLRPPGRRAAPGAMQDRIAEDLERYFRGEPVSFRDIEVDYGDATDFESAVYDATRAIPYGQVATYGQIAKAIGRPNAPRAVGQALGKNPVSTAGPCPRGVATDGP